MIRSLLPHGVIGIEEFGDPPEASLLPEEKALIARAVEKRRREFTTVRYCARRALSELGYEPAPLLIGASGAPIWLPGVVGSMTHCDGYRAAAVANKGDVHSLGIDAEPNMPLPRGVLNTIGVTKERTMLLSLPNCDVNWDRLLFCLKEAVFKAWFPLTQKWLEFTDVSATINARNQSYCARLSRPEPIISGIVISNFTGRWALSRGVLAAANIIPT